MTCRGRDGLTGGSSDDLDGIDGSLISDGEDAIVFNSANNNVSFHKMNASSGASENSPHDIVPDDNPDNKVWEMQGIAGYQTHSEALDIVNAIANAASTASLASTTFGNAKIKTRAFDASTAEYMHMLWNPAYDINTVSAAVQFRVKFAFASASLSSAGVAFTLKAHQAASGGALGGSWGTTATVTKTGMSTSSALYMTGWQSLAVSSIAANSPISLMFGRNPSHASDNAAGDALVMAVEMKYTRYKRL